MNHMKKIIFLFLHRIHTFLYFIISGIFFIPLFLTSNFYIMILFFISIFISLLHYFIFNPITFDVKEKTSDGSFFAKHSSNQILLFVDTDYIKNVNSKSKFSECIWDHTWFNTLEQEVGSFSVTNESKKLIKKMNNYSVVIFSNSNKINKEFLEKIKNFTRSGGIVVFNYPSETNVCDFAGLKSLGKTQLLNMLHLMKYKIPFKTKFKTAKLKENVEVILKEKESPLIIRKKYGKGTIITILFDYGLGLLSLQQGKPDENFNVINHKRGFYNLDTPDLVSSENLVSNFIPYADIVERYIVSLIENETSIIRLWYFPPEYNSAVIMSHDEEGIGDKAIDIVDMEKTTSSYSIVPYSPISKDTINRMKKYDVDFGLHWIRLNRKFIIFNRKDSLDNQIKKLENKTGKIVFNRTHHLDWGTDFMLHFKILCGNKIKIDSSYGPNPKIDELYGFSASDLKGYLFGTGLPYIPLDRNGLPLRIYEIPFQFQENFGNVTFQDMKKILNESMNKYYQITSVNYHPIFLERSKKYLKYFLKVSKPKQIWKTNFRRFYGWWVKRALIKISKEGHNFNITSPIKFKLFIKNTQFLNIDKKRTKGKPFKINDLNYHYFFIPKGKHTIKLI